MAIGEIEAKLEGALNDPIDGALVLSIRVPKSDTYTAKQLVQTIRTGQESGKERLKVCFSWYREKRSNDANAYFHVLLDKIAKAMNLGADEVKVKMVLEYGTIMQDEYGKMVGFKLPVSVDVSTVYKYAKLYETRKENGKDFNCFILYWETHTLDKAEMKRLIDGVVYEAQELGIETRTPDELASLIENWEGK